MGRGGMGLKFSGSVYHNNSKEAFQLALDMEGADGIEIDVRLSKDGDLWAFHDNKLDETTDASGCIENKLFQDLDGVKFKGLGKEKLMRLKDLNLNHAEKRFLLDLRHYNSCAGNTHDVTEFITALNDLPEYLKNTSRIRLITSNVNWISPLTSAGFTVLFSNDVESEINAAIQAHPLLSGIVVKNSKIFKAQVQNYKSQGIAVYIYEVRSPKALKEVRDKDPDAVLSDDLQGAIIEMK